MLTNQLASKYAQAIYELADSKGMLDAVQEQLMLVDRTISSHQDLYELIYHPRVPVAAKKETIGRIFGSDLADFVRNFLFLLADKRRETALPAIIKEYVRLANEKRNIAEAEVITAQPLSDEEYKALRQKLSSVTCKNIILKPQVDASIIGGVVVKIGGKLIDGSVTGRIQALRTALLKG
jgi:F-type H+-transporting ATPase subunit delta